MPISGDPLQSLLDSNIHIALKRQLNSFVWPISWWDTELVPVMGRASTPKTHPILGPFPQQVHHEWIFPGVRPSVKLNTSKTALFKYSFKNDGWDARNHEQR